MHYYKFNIADWNLSTAHLSIKEESVYFRLINFYYDSEQPIPKETQMVFRRLRLANYSDIADQILAEFFELTDKGWIHDRCNKELKEYKKKSKQNKLNGAKGGRPKKDKACGKTQNKPIGLSNGNQAVIENNPNHKPITNNHKPIKDIESPKTPKFDFKKELINLGVEQKLVSDWMAVRRKKKAANTETALRGFLSQVEISGLSISDAVRKAAENSWCGFKAEWIKKVESKGEYSFMKNVEDF